MGRGQALGALEGQLATTLFKMQVPTPHPRTPRVELLLLLRPANDSGDYE